MADERPTNGTIWVKFYGEGDRRTVKAGWEGLGGARPTNTACVEDILSGLGTLLGEVFLDLDASPEDALEVLANIVKIASAVVAERVEPKDEAVFN